MSQNENDLLDSLLDSLSDDQEMEKKIDEFARNKERQRRIQRARETSEQFQQTYSSSAKNQKLENAGGATPSSPKGFTPDLSAKNTESPAVPADESGQAEDQEVDIPDFVSSEGSTIPLDSLHGVLLSTPDVHSDYDSASTNESAGLTRRFDDPVYPDSTPERSYSYTGAQEQEDEDLEDEPVLTRSFPLSRHPDVEATRPIGPSSHMSSISSPASPEEDGSTRVFDTHARPDGTAGSAGNGTVRVNNDEIRSLLEKEDPILKREYIQDEEDLDDSTLDEDIPAYRRPSRKKNKTKLYLTIGAVALALFIVVGGGFAVKNWVDSSFQVPQTTSQNFEKLRSWASSVEIEDEDTFLKDVASKESLFVKLSDDQKKVINDLLAIPTEKFFGTSKTFDELLAMAKKGDVPKSSNENVANAEKKAKIKDEISSLQSEVNTLTAQLNQTTARINEAKAARDNATNVYNAATLDVQNCQNTYDSLSMQYASIPSDEAIQNQITALQRQVEQMIMTPPATQMPGHDDDDSTNDDDSHVSSTVPAPSEPSSSSEDRQALINQIDDLKGQLEINAANRQSIGLQLADAQTALQVAQSKVPEARSAMDSASGAYEAIKNDAAPIQAAIDAKNAQIADLQAQLAAIE